MPANFCMVVSTIAFHAEKTVGQGQKLQGRKCITLYDFTL